MSLILTENVFSGFFVHRIPDYLLEYTEFGFHEQQKIVTLEHDVSCTIKSKLGFYTPSNSKGHIGTGACEWKHS